MRLLPFAALALLSAGCGCVYSFRGYFPPGLSKAAVVTFENSSGRFGLGPLATEAFIAQTRMDGRLEVVPQETAGLLIEGEVTSFRKTPEQYDPSGKILTYRVTVSGQVSFKETATDQFYLGKKSYTGKGFYDAESQTEEDGLKEALENLADNALLALFSVEI